MITFDIFFDYLKSHKFVSIIHVITIILSYTLESIVLPSFSASLFKQFKSNSQISSSQYNDVFKKIIYIMILLIFIQASNVTSNYIESIMIPNIWKYFRNHIVKNILLRYENDFQDLELGKIQTELNTIPGNFIDFFQLSIENIVPRLLIILVLIIYFFTINWKLGITFTILMICLYFIFYFTVDTCVNLSNERYKCFGQINETVQDKLSNLATPLAPL